MPLTAKSATKIRGVYRSGLGRGWNETFKLVANPKSLRLVSTPETTSAACLREERGGVRVTMGNLREDITAHSGLAHSDVRCSRSAPFLQWTVAGSAQSAWVRDWSLDLARKSPEKDDETPGICRC